MKNNNFFCVFAWIIFLVLFCCCGQGCGSSNENNAEDVVKNYLDAIKNRDYEKALPYTQEYRSIISSIDDEKYPDDIAKKKKAVTKARYLDVKNNYNNLFYGMHNYLENINFNYIIKKIYKEYMHDGSSIQVYKVFVLIEYPDKKTAPKKFGYPHSMKNMLLKFTVSEYDFSWMRSTEERPLGEKLLEPPMVIYSIQEMDSEYYK